MSAVAQMGAGRRRNRRVVTRLAGYHSGAYAWSHSRLLMRVTLSELRSRYAGAILGMAWVAVGPLLILAVYAGVYLLVFRVHVPGLSGVGYVLYIFSGLVPYLMVAEALSYGVASVLANKAVLSNTVFPIELAPVKAVALAQPTMMVGSAITIAGVVFEGRASWTLVEFLYVWLCLDGVLVGLVWILSLLNVVFRDLQNMITSLLMVMVVISPIAYTPEMVPEALKPLITLNPYAHFVIAFQRTMVLGLPLTLHQVLVLGLMAVITFALGGWFFARTKPVLIDYV